MKNKILVDDEVFILDDKEYSLNIIGNNTIYVTDEIKDYNLNITLSDNSSLKMYVYNKYSKNNKILINQYNNTNLSIIHVFDINDEYNLKIDTNIIGNNNISDILLSGVVRGEVALDVDGIVNNNTCDNILNENVHILTRGGKVTCSPMLHVSTKNVIANHGNSISNINEDELFYLMMKGISKNLAIKLIENSYVLGIINDQKFIELINN